MMENEGKEIPRLSLEDENGGMGVEGKVKTEESREKFTKQSSKIKNILISSPKRKSKSNNTSLNPLQSSFQTEAEGGELVEIKVLADPRKESMSMIDRLKDKSWKTQYSAIATMRSLAQYH